MRAKAPILMALALFFSLCAIPVYGQFQLPHTFYGNVTINGNPAPVGTVITAVGNNVKVGDSGNPLTTTESGKYGTPYVGEPKLVVQRDQEDIQPYTQIKFYVNSVYTGQTAQFVENTNTCLDLSVSIPIPIGSYSDPGHTVACETFDDYATEHIVYMYTTSLRPNRQFKVAYYDGGNDKRATETDNCTATGNLTSRHTFVQGTDVAGTWRVIVCETSYTPPNSYNATWQYTLASDNFTVQDSAIPEFPTPLVVIASLSLCAGIYLWLRRKAAIMVT